MKILHINASAHRDGATKRGLDECDSALKVLGAKTDYLFIGDTARHACTACGRCKKTGSCVFGDIDEIAEKLADSDGIIIGIPTHYGGAPGNILSVISRLLFSAKECVEYKPVAVIGAGRRGCICAAIEEVMRFFTFSSSSIVTGIYPPILYGTDYESAGFDAEGLQNMRSVANNIYWLTAAIAKGREHGIVPSFAEKKIKTDISSLL